MRVAGAVCSALLLLVPVALRAATVKRSAVSIPLPTESREIPLKTLTFIVAGVDTVRLEPVPPADADPAEADWIFTARNGDGQLHRVSVTVTLLDSEGTRLVAFNTKVILPAGSKGTRITVHMKVNGEVWRAARRALLAADWFL